MLATGSGGGGESAGVVDGGMRTVGEDTGEDDGGAPVGRTVNESGDVDASLVSKPCWGGIFAGLASGRDPTLNAGGGDAAGEVDRARALCCGGGDAGALACRSGVATAGALDAFSHALVSFFRAGAGELGGVVFLRSVGEAAGELVFAKNGSSGLGEVAGEVDASRSIRVGIA